MSGRLEVISNQLIMSDLDYIVLRHDAPKATREHLLRVHTEGHEDRVFAAAPTTELRSQSGLLTVRTRLVAKCPAERSN